MSYQQPSSVPSYPPPPPGHQPVMPKTSALAITSLVLGIAAFFVLGFTGIFAVIFGHIAMSKIKRSNGELTGTGMALGGVICGYIGILISLCVIGMFVLMYNMMNEDPADQREPFDVASTGIPDFPEQIPRMRPIPGTEVQVTQFDLGFGRGPGAEMQFRLYVPPGWDSADPGSLTAVLLAPAGTNLLSGAKLEALDDETYHDEALPYAEAGMICVMYSIDGGVDPSDSQREQDASFIINYEQFKEAMGGIVNGRNALEFVLQRLPYVDPQKIYAAGHSSAGTLALLLAIHEPRLAGCAAYAPCTDVTEFHRDVLDSEMIALRMFGVNTFLVRSSPITHAARMQIPLYLFHSEDDEVCRISQSENLVEALGDGSDVTFETVRSGGHYDPMIEHGIPGAIEWIRAKNSSE